jgi:hypothetical protein
MIAGRLVAAALLLGVCGCQSHNDAADRPDTGPRASGTSDSCARKCNTEFDTCTGRFAGLPRSQSFGGSSDDIATGLGPNNVCPSQFRSCVAACS